MKQWGVPRLAESGGMCFIGTLLPPLYIKNPNNFVQFLVQQT
jgi:hypothetical protein